MSVEKDLLFATMKANGEKNKGDFSGEGFKSRDEGERNAPDWNQNDPSGAGYIKNRTHWVETAKVALVQDMAAEFSGGDAVPVGSDIELSVGRTYEVIWDGKPYSCVAYLVGFGGQSFPAIGNASIGDPSLSGGNNEPFIAIAAPGMTIMNAKVLGKHTFTISGEKEIIHRLDAKYIELTSPNGTKFTLMVDDDGTLYAYNPNFGPV